MTDVFFDTNVLLYAIDRKSDRKRDTARILIASHAHAGTAVISTQVLQEAYVNGIKKFGLAPEQAAAYVSDLAEMRVIGSNREFVLKAIAEAQRAQISLWDGLMVTAAAEARCDTLYTEDLNDGQVISGVTIVNPFKSAE